MKDSDFAKMVNSFPQSDSELGDLLFVSTPTVTRWGKGQNLPVHRLRTAMLEILQRRER